jgi:hypothetical protein
MPPLEDPPCWAATAPRVDGHTETPADEQEWLRRKQEAAIPKGRAV